MNKLQTLKDLSVWEWINRDTKVEEWIKLKELKAEAIKWVKGDLALFEPGSKTWKFIIHFFNLTEEDLLNTTGIEGEISNTPMA